LLNLCSLGALLAGEAHFPTHLQLTFTWVGRTIRVWGEEALPMPSRSAISGPGRSAFRGLAFVVGAIAWTAAAVVGVVLAVALLALAGAALSARRTVRAPVDPDLIEARNIGGHSWVAYGWDGRPQA
jgi:hypothetical protein